MQVFEFHFNPPKAKLDLIFDSFCYEPENFYEKKLGNLYLAGLLKNVLPHNARFLDNLAKVIKEKYYQTTSLSPEKSLKESLKRANQSLEKIAKKGDVSWLGNLNFGAISVAQNKKTGAELNFTKVGGLKIFLLREGQITDIDKKLKFEEIEPYPLKIFGNIVSGKLAENDLVLILTKEVADFFQNQNLLNEIARILPFDYQKLKEIINQEKGELSKISGLCLLILCTKESLKEKETLSEKKTLKVFSFKEVFSPLISLFKIPKILPKLRFQEKKFKRTWPKVARLPSLPKIGFPLPAISLNKNIILIFVLILFLAFGFYIFQKQEKEQLKIYQAQLEEIKQKVEEANSYLILAKTNLPAEKKANSLLKESLEKIDPLIKVSSSFSPDFVKQVSELKKTVTDNLYQLNQMEVIENIQPFFEFKSREFVPQKMILFKENLYFFNPYSENVFELKISQPSEGKVIAFEKKFNLAFPLADSILFFSKPNQLINFKDGQFQTPVSLEIPYPNFIFNDFTSYLSNLYFLDSKNGEVVKYPHLKDYQWDLPQLWFNPKIKKAALSKSIAADGAVWVLNKNNALERYYSGNLQQTISLDIFPSPQDFSKIFTSPRLSYLYLLEPAEKRIIILNKSGQLVKQFKSEKFDNLLDLAVSEDGKTIYLLNGLKVYQITP